MHGLIEIHTGSKIIGNFRKFPPDSLLNFRKIYNPSYIDAIHRSHVIDQP